MSPHSVRGVGYDRYSFQTAFEEVTHLYDLHRLYAYFQPVSKFGRRSAQGAKIIKPNDRAQKPYQCFLVSGVPAPTDQQRLEALYKGTSIPLPCERNSTLRWIGSGDSLTEKK